MTERAEQLLDRRLADLLTLTKESHACRDLENKTERCRIVFDDIDSTGKKGLTSLSQLNRHIISINEQLSYLETAKNTFEESVNSSLKAMENSPLLKEPEKVELYRNNRDPLPEYQACIDRVKLLMESLFVQMRVSLYAGAEQIAGPTYDIQKAIVIAAQEAHKAAHPTAKALEIYAKKINVAEEENMPAVWGDRALILSKKPDLNIPQKSGLCTYLLVGDSLFVFSFVDFRANVSLGYELKDRVNLDGSLRIVCGNAVLALSRQSNVKMEKRAFFYLNGSPEDDEKDVKLSLLLQLSMEVAQFYSFHAVDLKTTVDKQGVFSIYNFVQLNKMFPALLSTWERKLTENPPQKQILPKHEAVFKDYLLFE